LVPAIADAPNAYLYLALRTVIEPERLRDVPIDKLVKFRERHSAELAAFRQHVAGLATQLNDIVAAENLAVRSVVSGVLAVLQGWLVADRLAAESRLVIVTRGAVSIHGEPPNAAAAAVWGHSPPDVPWRLGINRAGGAFADVNLETPPRPAGTADGRYRRGRGDCASAGHRHRGGRDLSWMSGILADSSYRLLPA
jgi:Family of unknown function (DUF6236)